MGRKVTLLGPPAHRYCYDHPRPALTVDCVVFGLDAQALEVLLVRRAGEPFAGRWALPGGFVEPGETLEQAARRELAEETGLCEVFLEQLYTFGDPGRDPRGRVVSVAYYALVNLADHQVKAASDAGAAAWFCLPDLPALAFDHDRIVAVAHKRLESKIRYAPIGFELLPPAFSLSQLQRLYEKILDRRLDKRNFRKKILAMDLVVETQGVQERVAHRAARLYRFDRERYMQLQQQGSDFQI